MAPDFGLSQVFHLAVLAYFIGFDKFVFTELLPNIVVVDQLGENIVWMAPQFATLWAQFVFQDYFVLSFLEDILAWTPKTFWRPFKQILTDHANNLLTIYLIPCTFVMCVNFWAIFLVDCSLIDEYGVLFNVFDRLTNHVVHTYVIPLMIIETCITRRHYPPSVTVVYPYVKLTITLATYFAIVFGMKLFSPVWPYPFFKAMTASQWVLYLLGNFILAYVSYAVGFFCNAFVWGKPAAESVQYPSSSEEGGWNRRSMWRNLLKMVQIVESR